MILLTFTSALKYVLSLMLAMLGYIPFDSLETKAEETSENNNYFHEMPIMEDSLLTITNEKVYVLNKKTLEYLFIRELEDSSLITINQAILRDTVFTFEFGKKYLIGRDIRLLPFEE